MRIPNRAKQTFEGVAIPAFDHVSVLRAYQVVDIVGRSLLGATRQALPVAHDLDRALEQDVATIRLESLRRERMRHPEELARFGGSDAHRPQRHTLFEAPLELADGGHIGRRVNVVKNQFEFSRIVRPMLIGLEYGGPPLSACRR